MKRVVLLTYLALAALTSCQPAPIPTPTAAPPSPTPGPTSTPLPPTPTATATPPPTGISGRVEYTGAATGGILIFTQDHLPGAGEAPNPAAISTFSGTTGEFEWDLPAGTYYIIAFLTIDRSPQGPAQPNEPLVLCAPIGIADNVRVNVEVLLTDDDIGGQDKACVKEG